MNHSLRSLFNSPCTRLITRLFSRQKWLPIAVANVVFAALLAAVSPAFLSLSNFQSMLVQSGVTAIMAVGMTFIITAGIDISMGAILFFTSALFAQLMLDTQSYLLAFSAAMCCATLLGAINGLLVIRFHISPLITTLATYSILSRHGHSHDRRSEHTGTA